MFYTFIYLLSAKYIEYGGMNVFHSWVLAFILVFQVVPRIVLEAFPAVLLLEKKQKEKAIDLIVSECR